MKYDAAVLKVVSPLHRCREGGVLTRPGHTEAAVDLARLAGCSPAGHNFASTKDPVVTSLFCASHDGHTGTAFAGCSAGAAHHE